VFLVEDKRHGTTYLVFTWEDPRKDGYSGKVVEDVVLDYDMEAIHSWPHGHARPDACVGQDPNTPKEYKVFKYKSDLQAAGFKPIAGTAVVFGSWSDYLRLNPDPSVLEKLDEEAWFERLDELDEGSRRRRKRSPEPDAPAGNNRDEVAAWVARSHLIADSGIREVRYLPKGAPPDEIRMLELNDRLADGESKPEAIDFGLDIQGTRFRLLVADITTDQFERIQQDPSRLPPGWSLDGNRTWRRGA
jgi:hypothetical protein